MKENEYWFKNKRWGYGWSPNTVKGWLVTLGYLIILGFITIAFAAQETLNLVYSVSLGLLAITTTVVLFFISLKHAPSPKWQWNGVTKKKE